MVSKNNKATTTNTHSGVVSYQVKCSFCGHIQKNLNTKGVNAYLKGAYSCLKCGMNTHSFAGWNEPTKERSVLEKGREAIAHYKGYELVNFDKDTYRLHDTLGNDFITYLVIDTLKGIGFSFDGVGFYRGKTYASFSFEEVSQ